jgi:hypothetical protein
MNILKIKISSKIIEIPLKIVSVVLKALENERALDIHLKNKFHKNNEDGYLPNYKILKLISFRKRLGWFFFPAIIIWSIISLVNSFVMAIFFVVAAVFKKPLAFDCVTHIISTSSLSIIEVIKSERENFICDEFNCISPSNFQQYSKEKCFECLMAVVILYFKILFYPNFKGMRIEMLLHARDSVSLISLCSLIIQFPNHIFVTDDHYQRWSYILSNLSSNFILIQHGYLDSDINFPNKFGSIGTLYLRSIDFGVRFSKYFDVYRMKIYKIKINFHPNEFSDRAIFIASSSPFIEHEIDLARKLSLAGIPIILKLHPYHVYDNKLNILLSLASYVCQSNENPLCEIFVSYNSFLYYDYVQSGIFSISMESVGGSSETFNIIFSRLNEKNHKN